MRSPPFQDLGSYLRALEERGLLQEVSACVDPQLEVAEIHRRVLAAQGRALLFKHVRGSAFPLVTNLFGSRERVELAFGGGTRELIAALARAPERLLPPSLSSLWAERRSLCALLKVGLRRRETGPVLAHRLPGAGLDQLPLTTSWPGDGGAFGTLGMVYSEHPASGVHNLGLYRLQRHDASTLGLHWQIAKGGGFHHLAAEAEGQALPVNVIFGGPPALVLAAVAPLPENTPELLLASLAAGRRLALARNPAGPLPLVARAEFCLVGEALPFERRAEGPFGDHYGSYSLRHDYPVFRCRAIYHREGAVLPATVVGKPCQEDFFIGDWLQELLSPLFPLVMPGVLDLWSYGETGYHALAAARVRERYGREAMQSAFRILGEGQLSLTKFLLVCDQPVDLHDFKQVLVHVLERADLRCDLYLFSNLSMDTLDYAGPRVNEGSKGVLLGLGDKRRDLPAEFKEEVPPQVRHVAFFCAGCLVVDGAPFAREPDLPLRVARDPAFANWPLVVLADDARLVAASSMNFLWHTFTRFDPARDVHSKGVDLIHNHVARVPPLVIDARTKPGYPPQVAADPETRERVDRRWSEYFPRGDVDMGDAERGQLDP